MLAATAPRATSADKGGVTGRDGYLVCSALGYAIATIEALPSGFREPGDARDMRRLLSRLTPRRHDVFVLTARRHLEQHGLVLADGEAPPIERREP